MTKGPFSYFYRELLPAQTGALKVVERGTSYAGTCSVPAGEFRTCIMKFGPGIGGVFPTAGTVYYLQSADSVLPSLNIAPGSLISIYGFNLAQSVAQATSLPLPPVL